jgi:hypothetical protein
MGDSRFRLTGFSLYVRLGPLPIRPIVSKSMRLPSARQGHTQEGRRSCFDHIERTGFDAPALPALSG